MAVGFLGLASHLGAQAYYNGRILPGVNVAGRDLSGLTLAQARGVLRKDADSYRLHLKVADEKYVLTAAELGVAFDPDATVTAAYASGRDKWLPPLHHESIEMVYKLDRSVLNSFATSVADRVGTSPVDAGVVVTAVLAALVFWFARRGEREPENRRGQGPRERRGHPAERAHALGLAHSNVTNAIMAGPPDTTDGRGTTDDKGPALTCLLAVAHAVRRDIRDGLLDPRVDLAQLLQRIDQHVADALPGRDRVHIEHIDPAAARGRGVDRAGCQYQPLRRRRPSLPP